MDGINLQLNLSRFELEVRAAASRILHPVGGEELGESYEDGRSVIVNFRASQALASDIERVSSILGVSKSDFLRLLIVDRIQWASDVLEDAISEVRGQ
jgi:hypothetical protein